MEGQFQSWELCLAAVDYQFKKQKKQQFLSNKKRMDELKITEIMPLIFFLAGPLPANKKGPVSWNNAIWG